jgi:8-oxo-dGTP pyrophosphatase MutT (NUDIX family)
MEELINDLKKYEPYNSKEALDKEVMLEFINNNEDVLTRNNRIAHFTASAWIVNKERTKVLMIYHNIYDSWAWVGGHADGDANLLRVVKKEVEEETGITKLKQLKEGIYGINIVTVDHHIKRGKDVNSHLHFDVEYLFEADEHDELRIKEDENSGVKWININDIENKCSEIKMIPVYKCLAEKLKNI